MPEQPELTGWGEIAAYLGVSVRAAQMHEVHLSLPVHRRPGLKGRVWASSTELDHWRRGGKATNAAAISNPRPPGLPHEKGASAVPQAWGGAVDVDAKGKQEIPAALAAAYLSGANRVFRHGAALTAIVIFVVLGLGWSLTPHGQPDDFLVQGRKLKVVNRHGQVLWQREFPWELITSEYSGDRRERRFWLGDLNGDGARQIIFIAVPLKWKTFGTTVFCFDANGKLRWQFTPGRAVLAGDGSRMVPPYFTEGLEIIKGKTATETRVILSSVHYLEQPDQVAFLDVNGRVAAEYWHPGHVVHLEHIELGGRKHLLLGGVNNGNHQATLVMLDPVRMSGITTTKEMRDHRFELLGMPAAEEEAVVFFPRSCISADQPYTRVATLTVTQDRIVADVAEGTVQKGAPGYTYEFDHHFRIISVAESGVNVAQLHEQLEGRARLDHKYDSPVERARLKAGIVVRLGG